MAAVTVAIILGVLVFACFVAVTVVGRRLERRQARPAPLESGDAREAVRATIERRQR